MNTGDKSLEATSKPRAIPQTTSKTEKKGGYKRIGEPIRILSIGGPRIRGATCSLEKRGCRITLLALKTLKEGTGVRAGTEKRKRQGQPGDQFLVGFDGSGKQHKGVIEELGCSSLGMSRGVGDESIKKEAGISILKTKRQRRKGRAKSADADSLLW